MKYFIPTLLFSCLLTAQSEPLQPNEALRNIVAADQADRSDPPSSFAAHEQEISSRDAERRRSVKEILARGEIRTAEDFFNAALVFQHGPTVEDIRLGYALVTIAASLRPDRPGPKAASCSAWDRLLRRSGKPQWYGTQFELSQTTGKFELAPVDETAVTDDDRKACGVPTLEESRRNASQFN